METRKEIAGYEGRYEVSDQGRFRNGNISSACLGRLKTSKGYIRSYERKALLG